MSQFPSASFYHGDKTTLKDILPLTDLGGAATLGWRVRQINNDVWMTVNAGYTAGVWNRDDTAVTAYAFVYEPGSDRIRIMQAPVGSNPFTWTEYAKFAGGSIEVAFKAAAQIFEGKTVTLTSDVMALSLIPTWNNAGVAFTGISLNVTDTASAAASLLLNLLVGGLSKFKVDKGGVVTADALYVADGSASVPKISFSNDSDTGLWKPGDGNLAVSVNGVERSRFISAGSGFQLQADPDAALQAATKQYVDARAATKQRSAVLVVPGNPAAGTTVAGRLIMPVAGTITAIKSTCRAAPATTYTYDINKGGVTLYTTQANRPTRTSGNGTGAVTHAAPDVTSLSAGDILDVDLDTAGTSILDVLFFIEFTES